MQSHETRRTHERVLARQQPGALHRLPADDADPVPDLIDEEVRIRCGLLR
jgi:hypothetical protein